MSTRPDPRWIRWAPWLLAGLTVLVYAGSLSAPFIFDDHIAVVGNANLRRVWPVVITQRWLVDLSFSLNMAAHGLRPTGFRVVNVLIHVLAGLCLWGSVRRAARISPHLTWSDATMDGIAFVASLLWLLHPLQTESVTYICQRYESMMGLCLLGTVYAFIRGVQSPGTGRAWFNAAIGMSLLGTGTKEVMAATPVVVLLVDRFVLSRSWREVATRWRVHAGLWLSLVVLGLITLRMLGATLVLEQAPTGGAGSLDYLRTQAGVILHYLRLSVWPRGLCLDYAMPVTHGWSAVWPQVAVVAAMGLAAMAALRWRPVVGALACSFFIVLAPSSSVMPLPDTIFEHRMYVSLACVMLLVTGGGYVLFARLHRMTVARVLAVAAILGVGVLTIERNTVYGSEVAMWADVVAQRPTNKRARIDYAVALVETGAVAAGLEQLRRVVEAIPSAERARFEAGHVPPGRFGTLSDRFHFFRAHANMGLVYWREYGNADRATAHYALALRAAPGHPDVTRMLHRVLLAQGVAVDALQAAVGRCVREVKVPEDIGP